LKSLLTFTLENSPLESTEILNEEIANSFLKMVCDVDDSSYPHKIPLDRFRSNYVRKLTYVSGRISHTVKDLLRVFLPNEEFLVGNNSVLLRNAGYIHLEKQVQRANKSAVSIIQRTYIQYRKRSSSK
jgi:hypothetical protein